MYLVSGSAFLWGMAERPETVYCPAVSLGRAWKSLLDKGEEEKNLSSP